jgi:hypothetical protein
LRSTIRGRDTHGDKGRPTDAGTDVPLIAQWKGSIPAGKVNQDLIDFTDFLPTLAIFCHYDPRWLNFQFSRYAQDKQYKLYHDGVLYDYRRDPLEKSPLAQTSLTPAQKQSRQKLQQALDTLK